MAGGAADGGRPLPLGTATLMQVPASMCGPSTAVPTSRCFTATVSCPQVAQADVRLKVSDPVGAVRGTIVFGTGGGGTGFWEGFGGPAVNGVLLPLLQQGFRLVQRSWTTTPYGWLTGPGGTLRLACRYATLVDRIFSGIHTGGAFCATGNSGGSSEVSYALAHYGLGRVLDLAVPTAGPPMGRIDHGCLGPAQVAGWASQCASLSTCPGGNTCEYEPASRQLFDQTYGSGMGCQSRAVGMSATWLADSVMSPQAQLFYPQTLVRFVFGTADCGESVPLGRLYADAITSDAGVVVVAGAPHATPSVDAGAGAIYTLLSAECVFRH